MLGVGFVPVRNNGMWAYYTPSETYELEYGEDEVEVYADAFRDREGARYSCGRFNSYR